MIKTQVATCCLSLKDYSRHNVADHSSNPASALGTAREVVAGLLTAHPISGVILATPAINQLTSLLHFMPNLLFNKCDIIKNDNDDDDD